MSEIEKKADSVPFYPDHVRTEALVVAGIMVLVVIAGIIGFIRPMGLQAPADPMDTPLHVKPEWYFLALYQILKYIPPSFPMPNVVGLLMVGVGVVAVWPFIDRKPETSKTVQKIRFVLVAIFLVVFIFFTILGEVS